MAMQGVLTPWAMLQIIVLCQVISLYLAEMCLDNINHMQVNLDCLEVKRICISVCEVCLDIFRQNSL